MRLRCIAALIVVLASMMAAAKESKLPAAYEKWVSEDVTYIITPEERSQFLTLQDDASRDDFVRTFWERRNPVPGNPENLFKEEHYRRMAYANEHYASGRPGWMTDRGKTYIVLGPPNSVTQEQDTNPKTETWHYLDRSVRFVDSCQCGEFEIQR